MSSDIFTNFNCLDELTQLIYQSAFRFVVLSTVLDDRWMIHVGLAGSEGRWWKGSWTEVDVHQILGSKPSEKLLEDFAEKLAELFIGGELYITNWAPTSGQNIMFTLGPASKRPMHVPLEEISAAEAADYATTIFIDIALQAQSRMCRLHASSIPYTLPVSTPSFASTSRVITESGPTSNAIPSKDTEVSRDHHLKGSQKPQELEPDSEVQAAQQEIKALKAELHKQKKRITPPTEKPVTIVRPHKGASLANPYKKARKYQAIEFASDDEE